MPKYKKTMKNQLCQGCLASGRKLSLIKEYLHIYRKLMEDVLSDQMKHKEIPQMCWECRSVLRSVQKFQERAKEAYESLTMKNDWDNKAILNPNLPTPTTNCTNSSATEICDDLIKMSNQNQIQTRNDLSINHTQNGEVKTEFDYIVEGIKEEHDDFEDIKTENEYIDIESITGESEYTDKLDVEATIKEEIRINEMELRNRIKLEKAKLSRKAKYKVIRKIDYDSFTKLCSAVKINSEDRQRCVDISRQSEEFLNANFKCESCIVGYRKKQRYDKHFKVYHAQSNSFECELCKARFKTKLILQKHMNSHDYKYVCTLCDYERLNKRLVFTHLAEAHRIAYECKECGLRFQDKYKDFYKHYNTMHRRFVCDYCGFRGTSKPRLINHIRVNHCENICKYCNKRYAVYHSMTRHIALRHTKEVTEESYCVECNMQFDNIMLYTRHLKTSVKHKPKIVFPCSECPNVYAKKTAMMNHYKYIHLQKTNYHCDKCSRYFLNGFRLRTHIATYHNNIQAPKNKICSYCGRGFVTNRILDNHIRTHTGERPFACSHCTATFAQKSALVTHARAIHKVMMRYATKE